MSSGDSSDILDTLGVDSWGEVLNMAFIGMFVVIGGSAIGESVAPGVFPFVVTILFIFGGTYWFYQSDAWDAIMGNDTDYRSARR